MLFPVSGWVRHGRLGFSGALLVGGGGVNRIALLLTIGSWDLDCCKVCYEKKSRGSELSVIFLISGLPFSLSLSVSVCLVCLTV